MLRQPRKLCLQFLRPNEQPGVAAPGLVSHCVVHQHGHADPFWHRVLRGGQVPGTLLFIEQRMVPEGLRRVLQRHERSLPVPEPALNGPSRDADPGTGTQPQRFPVPFQDRTVVQAQRRACRAAERADRQQGTLFRLYRGIFQPDPVEYDGAARPVRGGRRCCQQRRRHQYANCDFYKTLLSHMQYALRNASILCIPSSTPSTTWKRMLSKGASVVSPPALRSSTRPRSRLLVGSMPRT